MDKKSLFLLHSLILLEIARERDSNLVLIKKIPTWKYAFDSGRDNLSFVIGRMFTTHTKNQTRTHIHILSSGIHIMNLSMCA